MMNGLRWVGGGVGEEGRIPPVYGGPIDEEEPYNGIFYHQERGERGLHPSHRERERGRNYSTLCWIMIPPPDFTLHPPSPPPPGGLSVIPYL